MADFNSGYSSGKDIDYSWVLFLHENSISQSFPGLLAEGRPNAGYLLNYWIQIAHLETLLSPFLSEKYRLEEKPKCVVTRNDFTLARSDLNQNMTFVEKLNKWHQVLLGHAYSAGLLRVRSGITAEADEAKKGRDGDLSD